jgi:ankyrin repeat protein
MSIINACSTGDTNSVKRLLNKGVDVNTKNDAANTLLHIACSKGNNIIIKHLIDKGANVNSINLDGNTPLHEACYKKQTGAVRVLLMNGANSDIKNYKNTTPIEICSARGYLELSLLIEYYKIKNTYIFAIIIAFTTIATPVLVLITMSLFKYERKLYYALRENFWGNFISYLSGFLIYSVFITFVYITFMIININIRKRRKK